MNSELVLIIDDEPQIRKLLKIVLESNGYRVIQAKDGKEGILLAGSHQPDLILLDIGLPDMSGHQVLKNLLAWYTKPIIVLSVQNGEEDIVNALDSGASDYLAKPFRTGELLARIRSALKRYRSVDQSDSIVVFSDLEIDLISRTAKKNDAIVKLTQTEFNLLSLLVKHEGKVLTHQFILKEIWGMGYQTETQYLRVYVAQLRKKLETDPNHPIHIITESGVGYRFC